MVKNCEAFVTDAAFVLTQLAVCNNGFYTFDDMLLRLLRDEMAK